MEVRLCSMYLHSTIANFQPISNNQCKMGFSSICKYNTFEGIAFTRYFCSQIHCFLHEIQICFYPRWRTQTRTRCLQRAASRIFSASFRRRTSSTSRGWRCWDSSTGRGSARSTRTKLDTHWLVFETYRFYRKNFSPPEIECGGQYSHPQSETFSDNWLREAAKKLFS